MSAVKVMQIAASKGQKIFTITKANKNKILPLLNHDSGSMQDINQALNAGKEVITHQSRINHKSWTGSGYAIIDPDTGAGAYLISGGANGALVVAIGNFYGTLLYRNLLFWDMLSDYAGKYNPNQIARGKFGKQIAVFMGLLWVLLSQYIGFTKVYMAGK